MLKQSLSTICIVVIAIVIGVIAFLIPKKSSNSNFLKSVNQSNEYHATSTLSGTAAGAYAIATGTPMTLGSLVITSSTASKITLLDWGGTTSTVTTTIATVRASAAEGTYTFDVAVLNGLYYQLDTTNTGNFTITYR